MNLENLVRKNILKLNPYSSARNEFNKKANIFLDANENPFENGLNRYPDPNQTKLKEVIAEKKNIASDQIIIGNGSDEVLDLLYRAFCEPKEDEVITLAPSYGMYNVLGAINNIRIVNYGLDENFEFSSNGLLNIAKDNTKMILLCSPNNPTGNSIPKEIIGYLAQNFRGLIVLDEAYIDFSLEDSMVSLIDEFPNLVVCQTLSKAYGMAGIRLGIAFGNKDVIAILNRIKPPYNINQLSIEKAIESFSIPSKLSRDVCEINKEKQKLKNALIQLDIVDKVFPSKANFLLVKFLNGDAVYTELIEKGIVVRNRSKEYNCENCLRITIGTESENYELMSALNAINNSV